MPGIINPFSVTAVATGLPDRSLDFELSSSMDLRMANTDFALPASTDIGISAWYRRESTGVNVHQIFSSRDATAPFTQWYLRFAAADTLTIGFEQEGVDIAILTTTATYTDTASFHHIYGRLRTNEATADDRIELYHDGTKITSFGSRINPSLSATYTAASDGYSAWGAFVTSAGAASNFFDGLLYQPAVFVSTVPAIGDVYGPVDIRGVTGLHALLHTTDAGTLEDDHVRAANWTNTNAVAKSANIP